MSTIQSAWTLGDRSQWTQSEREIHCILQAAQYAWYARKLKETWQDYLVRFERELISAMQEGTNPLW
jgi:hypothetical protein